MSKLMFFNKVKWRLDFMKNTENWQKERERWAKLAKKHGLTLIGDGTPWGNDYQFLSPGDNGNVDIFTLGADAQEGGEGASTDIGNWNIQDFQ